jgi:hypothetical protein
MSEMVERVAKAICLADHGYDVSSDLAPIVTGQYNARARAAIAAMREPTDDVRQALGHIDEHVDKHSRTEHGIRVAGSVCWQRGIDAALGKPGKEDR